MARLGRSEIGVVPLGVDGDVRYTNSHTNTVTSTAIRHLNQFRTAVVTGDGRIDSVQILRPVFPDEQALDVSWDYVRDLNGFASEWLSETSQIPETERDGIGVVLGGDLSTVIDVFIQYDTTGDGTVDYTSETKQLLKADQSLTFNDTRLFGKDGNYRIVVQGLRSGDTINQADIGAVHDNL